jgi:DNA-binding response OmpR family regulator
MSAPPRPNLLEADRTVAVAQTLRELSAPAEALLRRVRRLAGQSSIDAPARFLTAIEHLQKRGEQLLEHVNRGLSPTLVRTEGSLPTDKTFRHDLRGHAAAIIGVCDLWQKKGATLPPVILAELQRVHEAASQIVSLLDRLSSLLSLSTAGCSPSPLLLEAQRYFEQLSVARESGRLLVVDDNSLNREQLREVLVQHGHEVIEASDGCMALDLLAERPVDLILLDVQMPRLSGFEVLERLKADSAWQHIPVIMISALDQLDNVVNCIARGAEDYLIRPCNELLLRARVGACLEKKRLRDREMMHIQRIDELLHALFPDELVDELKETQTIRARRHDKVAVSFLDIVGFTAFCDAHRERPEEVIDLLQRQVLAFEETTRRHGVQKIKTIGDAFMTTAGLLRHADNPVLTLLRCAVDLVEAARTGPAGWQVRIGIHVGPVVAGILGQSQYSFDLWGATVNLAARMESYGHPGTITLSPDAWRDVAPHCHGEPRYAEVRGLGPMVVWDFASFRAPSGEGPREPAPPA